MERCGAKTRKGTLCRHEAGWDTEHLGVGRCTLHGGSEAHAQVNGLIQLARREQQIMGAPLSIEPQDAILECIRIAAGEVAYASERIAELEQEDAVGAIITRSLRRTPPPSTAAVSGDENDDSDGGEPEPVLIEDVRFGAPALHIWITVRRQAMDRLVQYSFAALKAGIEERRVTVAEQQGALLAQAIQGILRELGVSDRPEVGAIVRRQLALVSAA